MGTLKYFMEKSISITVISRSCGITSATLRMWEKRYKTFSPKRLKNGQRYYSEDDLLRAKYLAILTQNGHSISLISSLKLEQLKNLAEKSSIEDTIDNEIDLKKIINHLTKFNLEALNCELTYLRNSMGSIDFIFKIILPTMQKVGLFVVEKKCSVSQEHIISTIIRDQLLKISLPNFEKDSPKVILATPEGNLHELGILLADIICRANKISTYYLGAAHPAESLGEAISALSCPTVILGAISSDHWNYEKNIGKYLKSIDRKLNLKVNFMLGGGHKVSLPQFKNISQVQFIRSFEEFNQLIGKI